MELSISQAATYEINNYTELLEQVCAFVQREIQSPSLPPLPVFTFWLENGNHFTGIPLKILGKDLNKFVTLISSDPIERPITSVFIPFSKIQSVQIAQSESIHPILMRGAQKAVSSLKLVTLAKIRNSFESTWQAIAKRHGLLPYVYFNWDEVGNSEFEKQNLVTITHALLKAIDTIVQIESKKIAFNKLNTLQISNSPVKEVQAELQGAFLSIKANFLRAPSLGVENELIVLLKDTLI